MIIMSILFLIRLKYFILRLFLVIDSVVNICYQVVLFIITFLLFIHLFTPSSLKLI